METASLEKEFQSALNLGEKFTKQLREEDKTLHNTIVRLNKSFKLGILVSDIESGFGSLVALETTETVSHSKFFFYVLLFAIGQHLKILDNKVDNPHRKALQKLWPKTKPGITSDQHAFYDWFHSTRAKD